jgi:hypothetical protein
MKNILFAFALLSISSNFLTAQIGISGAYSSIKTPGWEVILASENVPQYNNGYTIGIDYWTRLENYRVEFLPEMSYSSFDNRFDGIPLVPFASTGDMSILALSLNTQFYIFDIEGDCNCPTWGKEGGFFNKGFYFMLGPGVSMVRQVDEIEVGLEEAETVDETTLRLMLSAGAGLDIGLTKSITLTVFGRFRWHSSDEWIGINTVIDRSPMQDNPADPNSVITQFEPGLKIHYRWGE